MIRREHQQLLFARSREQLYRQLTSYQDFPSWLPPVDSVRLLAREAGVAIVEFALSAPATCRKVFEVVESPPDTITFHQVDEIGSAYSGRCSMTPAPGTQQTLLEFSLAVSTSPLRFGLRRHLRVVLTTFFDAIRASSPEVPPAVQAVKPATDADHERLLLRLIETPEGELELDLAGVVWRYRAGRGWRQC